MLHMNKKNTVWERLFLQMKDAAEVYEFDKECAAFMFGLATGIAIDGARCTTFVEIERLGKLREGIKASINAKRK